MTKPTPDHSPGRSKGTIRVARSLWYMAPGRTEIKTERLAPAPPGNLTVETHYSAISRGTERLIWSGKVPETEYGRMRAPHQGGDFPFPVKYGYSAAGVVIDGPGDWIGAHIFALHPHQDIFQLPSTGVARLPEGVPLARGTLAANMETALNALWDSGAGPGDRIVVIGAGIVGLLVTYLAARMPGTKVTVVDVAGERRGIAEGLGATFCEAGTGLSDDADIVFHTSASSGGLQAAINCCGFEATLVEMSWYGDAQVTLRLGGGFHSKRLKLISSQVGHVASQRRARWSYARRLETAAGVLNDDLLDRLILERIGFDELPGRLPAIFEGKQGGLSPVVVYPAAN